LHDSFSIDRPDH